MSVVYVSGFLKFCKCLASLVNISENWSHQITQDPFFPRIFVRFLDLKKELEIFTNLLVLMGQHSSRGVLIHVVINEISGILLNLIALVLGMIFLDLKFCKCLASLVDIFENWLH